MTPTWINVQYFTLHKIPFNSLVLFVPTRELPNDRNKYEPKSCPKTVSFNKYAKSSKFEVHELKFQNNFNNQKYTKLLTIPKLSSKLTQMNLNFAKLNKYSYLLLKIIKNKEKNYYYYFETFQLIYSIFWFI